MPEATPRAWRLFIAIPVPAADAHYLDSLLGPYRGAFPTARWQRPDAFHVTLRFLGETPPERTAALADHMARCAVGRGPFRLATEGGDGVVRRSGGVGWLRIGRGATEAATLAGCLLTDPASAVRPGSPAPPHLTVARRVDRPLVDALATASLGSLVLDWVADRLVLYRSHTGTPAGSSYEPLAEVRL